MSAIYRRILLKLSGEALAGDKGFGYDPEVLRAIAQGVADAARSAQIAVVIGGGNIFRGQDSSVASDRVSADHMGMLATFMNALALKGAFERAGIACSVLGAGGVPGVVEPYSVSRARDLLEQGHVVVCAGGTGCPYFTTDTAAALRALEIRAEALIKATKVDGIYDSDPVKNPGAAFYPKLSYDQVLSLKLKVMDLTAISLCRDNGLVVRVINIREPKNLAALLEGKEIGSIVA